MAEKSKLEKHIEALGEETSGNAHDAVTFSGKGLSLLKSLVGLKKSDKKARDEEDDDEDEDDDDEAFAKSDSNGIGANGGGVEDFDEEDEEKDPGQEGDEEIIANHGERLKGKAAVRKNAGRKEERRFEKSFNEFEETHEDVLDASDALRDLSKHVRSLAKSHAGVGAGIAELQESVRVLAKGLQESLKAQAAMAGDLELIKKQPVAAPAPGFLSFAKSEAGGKTRTLSKSEIADVVADAMAEGLVDGRTLGRLDFARTQAELQAYVNELPAAVQERL